MLPVVLFDDGKGELAPMTDLRPSFDVRTGALTMLERVRLLLQSETGPGWQGDDVAGLMVPHALEALARERHVLQVNGAARGDSAVLAINGRCTDVFAVKEEHLDPGDALIEAETGDIVAAAAEWDHIRAILTGRLDGLNRIETEGRMLASRPWHFRAARDETMCADLDLLLEFRHQRPMPHVTVMGTGAARVHPKAAVGPHVVLDVQDGDVVIEEEAVVRPHATIIGPAWIGPHATVLDHATIRPNTAVGPWCKVAGELTGVIMQGYSNKAHDGFLGDSWVGEWVNLGAGTTNSNLLNTYGEIVSRARPDGPNERTAEKFLGAVLGDHVKTAICTRIMTGCIVHTGTMWAAAEAVSGCVAPFTWCTDEGRRQFRLSKFLETARAMMARRHEELSPAEEARLGELHAAAATYFNTAP